MPARVLAGAMCVQRFDDSLNSAIHITYRISLRSSSMPEPRDPLLKVLIYFAFATQKNILKTRVWVPPAGAWVRARLPDPPAGGRVGGRAGAFPPKQLEVCSHWVWEL